jgi:hypothetical protein
MGKNEKTPITVNDTLNTFVEDMTDEQTHDAKSRKRSGTETSQRPL